MKRRKNMLSVLLAATMVCGALTGCGQDGGSGGNQENSGDASGNGGTDAAGDESGTRRI